MIKTKFAAIEQWEKNGQTLSFGAHKIFYCDSEEKGKPVLLLIHGFPTSSWDWREVWHSLSEQYRLVSFDMLGFGLSDKPINVRYSILTQADIAEQLVSFLGIESYHILAHDYGDTVAQELLARGKERGVNAIQSCLLLNGGVFPEVHQPLFTQRLLLGPLGPILARLAGFKKFKRGLEKICTQPLGDTELEQHWQLLLRNNGRSVLPKLAQYMKERVQYRNRWVEALTENAVSIGFINGIDDPISGQHMLDRYKVLMPEAYAVALRDTGHYPQNENPNGVLKAATTFWEERAF